MNLCFYTDFIAFVNKSFGALEDFVQEDARKSKMRMVISDLRRA